MSFWSKFLGRSSPGPKEVFAQEVRQVLATMPGVTNLVYARDEFAFSLIMNGPSPTLYLENLFAETREMSPEARAEHIRAVVQSLHDLHEEEGCDWEGIRARLIPLLRASTQFLQIDAAPLTRPFAPFLIEGLGIDSEATFAYVTPQKVSGWAVAEDTVYETARENLAAHVAADEDVQAFDPSAPYALWSVSRNDSYESSRLLLPGWLDKFRGRVAGRPVAIVPERSTLMVGGDADEDCLRRLIDTAKREYESSPRPISPALYTCSDAGRVVPLELPAAHPLASDVALGHLRLAATEYATQKAVLAKRNERALHIGQFEVRQRDDGSLASCTVWARPLTSLLPEAAIVAFVPKALNLRDAFLVAWHDVLSVAGDCLAREPGLDPPRWRTLRWPADAVIAELRQRALG